MSSHRPPAVQLIFLDWTRIGAFTWLLLYHVGMYYVSWDWHVKSPWASSALEPWMMLSSPWRMGLLFLVSGAVTALALARADASARWLGARSRRLGLPLLLGVVLIVPPQSYWQVVEQAGFDGSYLDFLRLYFSAYGGFCRAGDCLVLPTWNHLWFLPYLMAYTALLWAAWRWQRPRARRLLGWLLRRLAGAGLWWGPVVLLALARVALLSRFGQTHALVDDWYNHAAYGLLFLLGAVLVQQRALFQRMDAARWRALALALLAWAMLNLYFAYFSAERPPPEGLRMAQRGVYAAMQWAAIVAVLGFAHRHLDRDHRWRVPLNEAVFPCYVLHQTLIVLAAVALRPLQWPPAVEGPLLVALTLGGSLWLWRLLRRVRWLRAWIGIAPIKACAPAAPGSAPQKTPAPPAPST